MRKRKLFGTTRRYIVQKSSFLARESTKGANKPILAALPENGLVYIESCCSILFLFSHFLDAEASKSIRMVLDLAHGCVQCGP